jgi:hypothetical protein
LLTCFVSFRNAFPDKYESAGFKARPRVSKSRLAALEKEDAIAPLIEVKGSQVDPSIDEPSKADSTAFIVQSLLNEHLAANWGDPNPAPVITNGIAGPSTNGLNTTSSSALSDASSASFATTQSMPVAPTASMMGNSPAVSIPVAPTAPMASMAHAHSTMQETTPIIQHSVQGTPQGSLALDPALNAGFQGSALQQLTNELLSAAQGKVGRDNTTVRWEDMAAHPIFEVEATFTTSSRFHSSEDTKPTGALTSNMSPKIQSSALCKPSFSAELVYSENQKSKAELGAGNEREIPTQPIKENGA